VAASFLYSLVRVLLDVIATSHGDEAEPRAEVLALRRQVQVLERQIKRLRWTPGDRMIMAALRDHHARSAWAGLLVNPKPCREGIAHLCVGSGGLPRSAAGVGDDDPSGSAGSRHPSFRAALTFDLEAIPGCPSPADRPLAGPLQPRSTPIALDLVAPDPSQIGSGGTLREQASYDGGVIENSAPE